MTLISGIFNSVDGDRRYNAQWFASYFASFIGNGVFPNPSTGLQVTEGTNMQTIVKPGKGWINGYYLVNDSEYILKHDVADGVLKRIDRIVMKLNYLTRQIEIVVKKGAYASSPVAPALQRDTDAYELALADVLINNGATRIIQANITDTRLNTSLCGIVTGVIDTVDTTTIFNQYESWYQSFTAESRLTFEDWFKTVTDILDENVAGNLLTNIENHKKDYKAHPAIAYTSNVGNDYSTSIYPAPTEYVDGMGLVLKMNASSTGATTINVNGLGPKPILKGSGNTVKALYKDGMYTMRYNATALNGTGAFILQGEGGEYGTAGVAQVLNGYTVGTDDGILQGAMENRGSIGTVTPGTANKSYGAGYYNAFSVLGDPDLIATNIRSGKNIFGVNGSFLAKDFAKGVATSQTITTNTKYEVIVNTLNFTPKLIILTPTAAGVSNGGGYPMTELVLYIDPSVYFPVYAGYSTPAGTPFPIFKAYENAYGKYIDVYENKENTAVNNVVVTTTSNGFRITVFESGRQYNWVAFG